MGDIRADGYVYIQTKRSGVEVWTNPEAYLRYRVRFAVSNANRRAKNKDLPCTIDTDYLLSILPEDMICPVLRVPMEFGGKSEGRDNSPSVDRIIPDLGYVPGNIRWISNRANRLKCDASVDELKAVLADLESINAKEIN